MLKERFSRHFFVVHTFVSEEARREYLTPPEKREPPEPRPTELQWAVQAVGEYAQCMHCLLYTSPSPRDRTRSRMPSSA